MAISAACVWEVRQGGSSSNGGGYVSGGVDYSLQTAAQLTVTDGAATGTTNLNSVTGGFTSNMVGNIVNVVGQGRKQITAYVDTNNVTCDSAWGTFSGATVKVGGCLNLPSIILGTTPVAVPGNTVYVGDDANYALGATTETIGADGDSSGWIKVIGYHIGGSRTDADIAEASMPVFTTATNSVANFTLTGATCLMFRNIKVTHTAATRGRGWVNATTASSHVKWVNCVCDGNLDGWYFTGASTTSCAFKTYVGCQAKNCAASGNAGFVDIESSGNVNISRYINCIAHSNGNDGFQIIGSTASTAAGFVLINCIASGNGRDGLRVAGTSVTTQGVHISNMTFYGNTTTGLNIQNSSGVIPLTLMNCIFYNTNTGISCATASINGHFFQFKNAFGGNSTADRNVNTPAGYGDIALSGDPFTNAGSRDFSLDNTASEGAACRGVGYPAKVGIYDDTTATYLDVGAAQVQASAAGGLLTHPGMSGGMRA